MKTYNRKTGFLAEDLACNALIKKGYQILERNFANRFGEIDIIAKKDGTLIFVEVKAKKGIEFGYPWEMITPNKLKKIKNMATIYMKDKVLPSRIDVVAIIFSKNNEIVSLNHYENVYF